LIDKFKGNLFLTKHEKVYRLVELKKSIESNQIDKDCINFLYKFNRINWLCTTQCCSGHDGLKTPYIDIRISLPFEKFFTKCKEISHNFSIQILCLEELMPSFCFWFDQNLTWQEGSNILLYHFKK